MRVPQLRSADGMRAGLHAVLPTPGAIPPMKTVTVVIFDGVQSLDVSGPLDVFSEANRFLLPGDR